MRFGTGLLTVVATHAQRFVDQEYVCCFYCSGSRKELDDGAGTNTELCPLPLHQTRLDLLPDLPSNFRVAIEKRAECSTVNPNRLCGYGSSDRGTARGIHQHGHFAHIVAGWDIGADNVLAAAEGDRDGY